MKPSILTPVGQSTDRTRTSKAAPVPTASTPDSASFVPRRSPPSPPQNQHSPVTPESIEQHLAEIANSRKSHLEMTYGQFHDQTIGAAASPALGLIQLEAIKAVLARRVMESVATIPSATRQREAIITNYRQMGAELLAKFDVKDIVDIPSRQYAAAHQFLEGVVLAFGRKAGAQA